MNAKWLSGIFIALLLGCLAPHCLSQTTATWNKFYETIPLSDLLKVLQEQCDFRFSYDSDLIAKKQLRNLSLEDESCQTAFSKILHAADLDASPLGDQQFALFPKTPVQTPPLEQLTVRGKVLDQETGEVLPGATVQILPPPHLSSTSGTISDDMGNFSLQIDPASVEALVVNYLGYRPQKILAKALFEAPENPFSISLQGNPLELESVVVTSKNELPIGRSADKSPLRINPRKMDALSVLGERDVFRTLQFLPGVSSTEESANGLYIRGGTPDQNLVLIDGIPIYNTGHFFGMFHAFNADALERVDVSRGGFGVEHGGATAGLVNIQTKPSGFDSLEAGLSANLAAVSGFVAVPFKNKKVALMLAGRRSFNEVFQSAFYNRVSGNVFQTGTIYQNTVLSEEENLEYGLDPLSNFHDLHAKVLIDGGSMGRLQGSFYNGRDVVRYESIEPSPDDDPETASEENLTLGNTLFGLNYEVPLGTKVQLEAKTYFSNYIGRFSNGFFTGIDEDSIVNTSKQDNIVGNLGLETGIHWQPKPAHHFIGGLEISRIRTSFELSGEEADEEEPFDSVQIQATASSMYLGYEYSPGKLTLSPGLRATLYGSEQAWLWEPRLRARLDLGHGLRLNGNAGFYQQYLNPIQISNSLKLGMEFLALANDENDIEITQTFQTGMGVSWLRPGLWVDVQGYYKKFEGLERYVRSFDVDINATEIEEQLSEGSGTSVGLDLLVRVQKGAFTGWAGYTLSKVVHYFEDLNEGESFSADQDHRHQLNLVASVNIANWEFSATWVYATGKPYSVPVAIDSFVDVEGETNFELEFSRINDFRLPAYHRLDVNLGYRFPLAKIAQAKVGFSLFNLYNRANIRDRNYSIELAEDNGNRPSFVRIDRDLLGFSPNLFFRIQF